MSGGLETVQTLLEQVLEKHGISTVGAWDRARLPALSGAGGGAGCAGDAKRACSTVELSWSAVGCRTGRNSRALRSVLELKLYVDFAAHGSAAEIEKGFEMLEKELLRRWRRDCGQMRCSAARLVLTARADILRGGALWRAGPISQRCAPKKAQH